MDDLDRARLHAVFESIASYTVAIVPEVGPELATGVCLHFGDGYWVATVRHAVKDWGVGRLFFIPRPSATLEIGPRSEIPAHLERGGVARGRFRPQITRYNESPEDDLAVLGLDGPQENMAFHLLEQDRRSPGVGTNVVISGFPIETAQQATDLTTGETAGMVSPLFEWSEVVEENPRDFVNYDPSAHILLTFSEGARPDDFVSKAGGLSGAGVWRLPLDVSGRIFDPREVSLVGIQTRWYERRRLLKVARIERLVSLLVSAG